MSAEHDDFVRMIADLASKNWHATAHQVKQLFADSEVVFGVWQDDDSIHGASYLILKGAKVIMDLAIRGISIIPKETKIAAISCFEYEEAVAMKDVLGDRDYDA